MSFGPGWRQCTSTMDKDSSTSYRLQAEPSCNEEIFNIFRDKKKLSASEFKNVWAHYDKDMNGYIESDELGAFLMDLFAAQGHFMCKKELESLKISIIDCYDENRDGKIEVLEMTKFLPVESNFLLHFRIKGNGKMTVADFVEIWKHYDTDESGFLEEKEVGSFLVDLLRINQNITIPEEEVQKMVDEVMKNFDDNKDGLIEFDEMRRLMNVENNVLSEMSLTKNLSNQQFNTIFDYYDTDRSNFLEGDEVKKFVMDLMERADYQLNEEQMDHCIATALKVADKNNDGRISREELASFLYTEDSPDCRRSRSPKPSPRRAGKGPRKRRSVSPGKRKGLADLVEEYGNRHVAGSSSSPGTEG